VVGKEARGRLAEVEVRKASASRGKNQEVRMGEQTLHLVETQLLVGGKLRDKKVLKMVGD